MITTFATLVADLWCREIRVIASYGINERFYGVFWILAQICVFLCNRRCSYREHCLLRTGSIDRPMLLPTRTGVLASANTISPEILPPFQPQIRRMGAPPLGKRAGPTSPPFRGTREAIIARGSGSHKKTPMTQEDAARIQSAEARANGGKVSKGSLAARAQSAADKAAAPQQHQGKGQK